MLSKAASSTVFWVFGMTRPGIEPRSPGPLVNTLLIRPMAPFYHTMWKTYVIPCLHQPPIGDDATVSVANVVNMNNCCILTFDPAKNAIPRWCTGRKWHILMAVMRGNCMGGNWLMKWDEVKKFPWYTHRLMHRLRVTCKLHDSYFRWMTINHAIPKIE